MEESTFSILANYVKEFIPANKGHVMSLGFGLFIIGFFIAFTAATSGLGGNLMYLALSPGTSGTLMLAGVALLIAGAVMKLPE